VSAREGRILVSTHHLETAGALRDAFEEEGYGVELVTPDETIGRFDDAVLLILTGGLEGEEVEELVEVGRSGLRIPVFGIAPERSEAWRHRVQELGLDEAFYRPLDPDEVLLLGRTTVERRRLQEITGIVGETEAIREALERVVQIAPVQSTVLITGESGTGKELVARGIHALSPRRHKAFIPVNVAALSETLLESELFGHEKGAFTGAIDARKGFFELASGGTIFLDEIGEMPLSTQTKLLRVLEQREFIRVGGEKPLRVDVRIVAATNQDLRRLVAAGEFRRDLYYRLNVLQIELPPLRERKDDIPLLVEAFVEEMSRGHDRPFPGISPEAMEIFERYHWPGNVRELRNLVESMVVLSPGREIRPEDIPDEVRFPESGAPLLPAPVEGPALPKGEGRPREEGEGGGSEAREGREGTRYRPELEFIFRTLMELRIDVEELRREFEAYKEEAPGLREVGGGVPLSSGSGRYEIHVGRGEGEDEPPRVRVVEEPSTPTHVVGGGEIEEAGGPSPRDETGGEGETPRGPGSTSSRRNPEEGSVSGEAPEGTGSSPASDLGRGIPERGDPARGEESGEAEEEGVVVYRPGMTMDDLEREAIVAALEEVDGNRRRAAERLGIGERTLYRKIRKYDLDV